MSRVHRAVQLLQANDSGVHDRRPRIAFDLKDCSWKLLVRVCCMPRASQESTNGTTRDQGMVQKSHVTIWVQWCGCWLGRCADAVALTLTVASEVVVSVVACTCMYNMYPV
jgi:hypothetical protein